MAGLFAPSTPQAKAPTKLAAMPIQTSIQGKPVPIVYGTNRIGGNLIWYGDFTSTPVYSSQPAGKGGHTVRTIQSYNYSAAVAIGLCEGPINSIAGIKDNNGSVSTVTVTEEFTVPAGGGSVTVANAGNFSIDFGVAQQQPYSVATNDYGNPAGGSTDSGTDNVPMKPVE